MILSLILAMVLNFQVTFPEYAEWLAYENGYHDWAAETTADGRQFIHLYCFDYEVLVWNIADEMPVLLGCPDWT